MVKEIAKEGKMTLAPQKTSSAEMNIRMDDGVKPSVLKVKKSTSDKAKVKQARPWNNNKNNTRVKTQKQNDQQQLSKVAQTVTPITTTVERSLAKNQPQSHHHQLLNLLKMQPNQQKKSATKPTKEPNVTTKEQVPTTKSKSPTAAKSAAKQTKSSPTTKK
jgi:hypothetical protein